MALVLFFAVTVAVASGAVLQFDGDAYALGWKLDTAREVKNEYVRSGETVEDWQRLITVQQFPQNEDPAGFAKTLLNLIKQQAPGETPEVFQKQAQYMLCYFLEDQKLGKTEFIFNASVKNRT
jgi:hypothetical protein